MSKDMLDEAFNNPYGRKTKRDARNTQSAELGGDVSGFLASDEVPETVLGYRVLRTEELSESDLQFFTENPEAAGFFTRDPS
jgi:hypothetical protein